MPVAYRHQHRVTYAECTLGNHVYYARYLDILEQARGEFFRSLGIPLSRLQEEDAAFPVIECQLRYHSPARYDEILSIEIWPAQLERVRFQFSYRISNEAGKLTLTGTTTHVCTTVAGKPTRMPERVLELLRSRFLPHPDVA